MQEDDFNSISGPDELGKVFGRVDARLTRTQVVWETSSSSPTAELQSDGP